MSISSSRLFPVIFSGEKHLFPDYDDALLTFAAGCPLSGDYGQGMQAILLSPQLFHALPFQNHGPAVLPTAAIPARPAIQAREATPACDAIEAAMGIAPVPASPAVPAQDYVAATDYVPATIGRPAGPVDFTALQSPGPQPLPGATAALQKMFNTIFSVWQYNEELYLAQRQAISNFRTALVNSLSEPVKDQIKDGVNGIRYLSAGDIYSRLLIHYSTLTLDDITMFKSILNTKFVLGEPFKGYVVKQQQIHDVLERADQRVTSVDKVQHMTKGVAHIPAFVRKIEFWADKHPTVASQTFDSLCQSLQVAADNLGSTMVPAITTTTFTGLDSAAAVVANIPQPKTIFCDKHQSWGFHPTSACRLKEKHVTKYCWSHGYRGHLSVDCTAKRPGHDEAAPGAINPKHAKKEKVA